MDTLILLIIETNLGPLIILDDSKNILSLRLK